LQGQIEVTASYPYPERQAKIAGSSLDHRHYQGYSALGEHDRDLDQAAVHPRLPHAWAKITAEYPRDVRYN
jgi:hypothetical protein